MCLKTDLKGMYVGEARYTKQNRLERRGFSIYWALMKN